MADIIFPGQIASGEVSKVPDNLDLEIWQGDAQNYRIRMEDEDGVPLSLSGFTAQAVIRKDFTTQTRYPFTCTIENGNEVKLYMSSAVSATIPAGDYVWNFQLTDLNGDVRTYLAGDVTVFAQVD